MADTNLKRTTQQATDSGIHYSVPMQTGLTVAYHPDIARVGEVAPMVEFASGKSVALNRLVALFRPIWGGELRALATSFVSRKSVVFEAPKQGGIRLICEDGVSFKADGEVIDRGVDFAYEDLQRGVVLTFGNAVVLLFHLLDSAASVSDASTHSDFGLVGVSAAMAQVRYKIVKAARTDRPVLLRGETGVGKELVARAIHENSARKEKSCFAVNMSAIHPTLAASELFGHTKNAFTGAVEAKPGYFGLSDGGTLFLDEIGDTSLEIQALILRAVEHGEIQVVGAGAPKRVDVRLIAATDSDLDQAMEEGRFKRPLLERIQETAIHIPPLRERRDDISLLFFHFLKKTLTSSGEADKLDEPPPGKSPWFPASVVASLLSYEWPGNVRQLKNIASQIADANLGETAFRMDDEARRLLVGDSVAPTSVSRASLPARSYKILADMTDEEILEALRQHVFNISKTAETLGVSTPRLHARIDESPNIPKASKLTEVEIQESLKQHKGDIEKAAAALEVSAKGLKLRMRQLGLS